MPTYATCQHCNRGIRLVAGTAWEHMWLPAGSRTRFLCYREEVFYPAEPVDFTITKVSSGFRFEPTPPSAPVGSVESIEENVEEFLRFARPDSATGMRVHPANPMTHVFLDEVFLPAYKRRTRVAARRRRIRRLAIGLATFALLWTGIWIAAGLLLR